MSKRLNPADIGAPGDLRPAQYQAMARSIRGDGAVAGALSIGLLSSHSFSFLEPYLRVECARCSLAVSLWSGPFGQIEQAILDPGAELWAEDRDLVVIALRVEDVYPDAFVRASRTDGAGLAEQLSVCIDRLLECSEQLRSRCTADVLIANFALPHHELNQPLFDANSSGGSVFALAAANRELAAKVAAVPGAGIWDYAGLVAARGAAAWTDQRLWLLARQPISAANLPFAAQHLARTIAAITRPRAKCLVLDLDNTLWGGAAGDDGLQGIQLSDDFPGSAYKSFQRAVLGLRDQGVLLAISSKNDEQTVREIFDVHPDMLLHWEDFASTRVNWQPKSGNLLQIAEEIGIGADSLVLFDDNPVERAEVRLNAPEVNVVEVPGKPVQFQATLFECGFFDTPTLSEEDSHRARQYQDERRRGSFKSSSGSMQEFLTSLDMEAVLGDVGDETIARASQLIAKTNQFNLTTRRHSQAVLQQMVESSDHDVRWLRLKDSFGDSGIVGITIVHFEHGAARIDSFVMSCRVMNREVEYAMICDIAERCGERGCSVLKGEYVESAKNSMTADFFTKRGFVADHVDGSSCWYALDLSSASEIPAWPDVLSRN